MTITLYELAGKDIEKKFSPHCWKSHLALNHKNLDFDSEPVQFQQIKNKINFVDYSLVPVLVDDEEVVTNSWDITCYLEEKYPEKSLFKDAAGKALAESINHWCDTALAKYLRPLILMDIYALIADEDKAYFRQSREAKLGMTLEAFSEKADESLVQLREELESIREILSMHDFIGGESPSYADICLLGCFLWVNCVNDTKLVESQDSVNSWYQRMLELYPDAKAAVS